MKKNVILLGHKGKNPPQNIKQYLYDDDCHHSQIRPPKNPLLSLRKKFWKPTRLALLGQFFDAKFHNTPEGQEGSVRADRGRPAWLPLRPYQCQGRPHSNAAAQVRTIGINVAMELQNVAVLSLECTVQQICYMC